MIWLCGVEGMCFRDGGCCSGLGSRKLVIGHNERKEGMTANLLGIKEVTCHGELGGVKGEV